MSSIMRFCPVAVPFKALCIRDRRRSLDVHAAKDLLDSTFDPVGQNVSIILPTMDD